MAKSVSKQATHRRRSNTAEKRAAVACAALGHPRRLRLFRALLRSHPTPILMAFTRKAAVPNGAGLDLLVAPKRHRKHLKRLQHAQLVRAEKTRNTNLDITHQRKPCYLCSVNVGALSHLVASL